MRIKWGDKHVTKLSFLNRTEQNDFPGNVVCSRTYKHQLIKCLVPLISAISPVLNQLYIGGKRYLTRKHKSPLHRRDARALWWPKRTTEKFVCKHTMAGLSGLVADYGSSSDDEQDDDNLAEEL